LVFALLSIEILGMFFVLLAIKRDRSCYSFPEILSLSFFIGASFAAFQLLAYYFFEIDFNLRNVIAAPVVLFLLVFSHYFSRPQRLKEFAPHGGYFQKWNLTERLLFLGVLVQFLWVIFLVAPMPVYSHDAVANYALKAKIFYSSGGVPEGFFGWSEATVSHPDYPLLLPFLLTWVYVFTGFNDFIINMVMPVIYTAFLVLFYSQAKRIFNRPYAFLLVFFLATIPQLADYATVIHADLLLTALVAGAFLYFWLYAREFRKGDLLLSSVLFGFTLWTKNEAIVFVAAFAAVFIVLFARSEPIFKKKIARDIIVSFFIVAVISAPSFAVKIAAGVTNSDIDLSKLTFDRFLQNVKDIPVLLNLFQQEVFGPKKWNILWMMLLAAIVWKRRFLLKGQNFYVTLFIILASLGYFAGYMATTGNNLYFYVNTTISRFMLHFSGIGLFLLGCLVYDDVLGLESFKERM
jgi:4-amino-4-deoxy-L-arabinose transferase-like glycosyltransferase